jgi:hypothetical protein
MCWPEVAIRMRFDDLKENWLCISPLLSPFLLKDTVTPSASKGSPIVKYKKIREFLFRLSEIWKNFNYSAQFY